MPARNPVKVAWKVVKRYLRKGLAFFWSGITISMVVNIFLTWLTTKGFDLQGTPLGILLAFPLLSGLALLLLLAITLIIWPGSRETPAVPPNPAEVSVQRAVLLRLLTNEYKRQYTKLMQNAEGITLTLKEQLTIVASPTAHQLPPPWRLSLPSCIPRSPRPMTRLARACWYLVRLARGKALRCACSR